MRRNELKNFSSRNACRKGPLNESSQDVECKTQSDGKANFLQARDMITIAIVVFWMSKESTFLEQNDSEYGLRNLRRRASPIHPGPDVSYSEEGQLEAEP